MSGDGGSEVTIATVLHLNGVRSYISDDCPTRHAVKPLMFGCRRLLHAKLLCFCIATSSLRLAEVPKSVSLTILLDVSNAFSGFISPCTKSHSCVCANPWRMTSIMPCDRCLSSDVGHGGSEVIIATVLHLNGVRSYINDDCPTRHTPYNHIGSASPPGFLRGVCCSFFLPN